MGSTWKIRTLIGDKVRSVTGWAFSAKTQTKLWGAVLIALAVAWATYWLGPDSSTHGDSPSVSVTIQAGPQTGTQTAADKGDETLVAASRIRFHDWQQLIKTPADDATRRSLVENFRGETVTWEGYFDGVHEIDPAHGGTETSRFLLAMYESEAVRSSTALGRAPALCMLSESARGQVAELKPGQRVVIKGTLAAPETLHGSLLGTRLYNCEILLR
jgi:hypothetical protein